MTRVTKVWLVGQLVVWALLVVGWHTDTRWLIGAAVVVSLVTLVERWDNWQRGRRSGGAR